MPFSKKHLQVLCALLWCIVAAGPVFGFAALKPVLVAQGVYSDRCTGAELTGPCSEQDLALNYLFTLAAVVTNAASLIVGAILDRYGPRFTALIGAFFLVIASVIMANGKSLLRFGDAYLIGYSTLALGGPFVFISCFHLANAFPNNSGLILALLTGAFDSSLALFLLYRLAYTRNPGLSLHVFFSAYLAVPVFIVLAQIFVLPKDIYQTPVKLTPVADEEVAAIDVADTASIDEYLPIPAPGRDTNLLNAINDGLSRTLSGTSNILTDQYAQLRLNLFSQRVLLRPSFVRDASVLLNEDGQLYSESAISEEPEVVSAVQDIHKKINDAISKAADGRNVRSTANSILSESISVIEQACIDEEMALESGIDGTLHGAPLKTQMYSWWFFLMALFTSIQMLRINYFVATIRSQEEFLLHDPNAARRINEFFDIALPVGGLLSIPFIGVLLDNFQTITVLGVLLGVSLAIGVLGMIPLAAANYLGIMLMVLYRPFYYTAVSDYCAKVFGFTTFGTIYGSIICISGLFNFVQTALDHMTHVTFQMNPIPVNSFLTGLTALIGGALLVFIKAQPKKKVLLAGDETRYGSI